MSKSTILGEAQITASPDDKISVELIESGKQATVMITWPSQPTTISAAKYADVAATAMRVLANGSTELSRIKAGTRRL